MAESLGSLCLCQKALLQLASAFAKGGKQNRFQSNGLAGLRIVGFVNRASGGL